VEARAFAQSLQLHDSPAWRQYCKGLLPDKPPKPDDIPSNPPGTYKDEGWIGWGDWLGTGTVATFRRRFRPFSEARALARSLRLNGKTDWAKYCKGLLPDKPPKPDDIPSNPPGTYKDEGWIGWGDWLGTGTVATFRRRFRPFSEARALARSLRLSGKSDWAKYCKGLLPNKPPKPDDIPSDPPGTYMDSGWIGWSDWLGNGRASPKRRKGTRSPR
jgi:hypothetical protein